MNENYQRSLAEAWVFLSILIGASLISLWLVVLFGSGLNAWIRLLITIAGAIVIGIFLIGLLGAVLSVFSKRLKK